MTRQTEILEILQNFNFHPRVANSVLKSFCDRKGYEFLPEGEYQDHLYQYQHDQRATVIIPLILQAIQKYQYIPDYIGETKKKEMKTQNEAIEIEIAKLCSANGIQYREIDVLTKNFAQELGSTIENAGTRMSNMCALVISSIAQDVIGTDMSVKVMEDWHDNRAKELST